MRRGQRSARHVRLTRAAAIGVLLLGESCASSAPRIAPNPAASSSDSAHAPPGQRFYAGRAYGSEAQFNPVTTVVNMGFDQLSRDDADRKVFTLNYQAAATNVLHSMLNPIRPWQRFGWWNLVEDEILPLSTKGGGGGQWVPNWQLHALGEGMTSTRLMEWYAQHGYAHPELLGDLTNFGYGFLNEMIEHQRGNGANQDAATDLVLFDTGALLLWHFDRVRDAFSGRLRLTNWFPQATLAFPSQTLQNSTELYMMRARLGGADNWRPMVTFGGSQLVGVSRRVRGENWLTLAAGEDPAANPVIDPLTGEQTVTLLPNYGAFVDRDGSLLFDLLVRPKRTEWVLINVYPGAMSVGTFAPGLMMEYLATHQARLGIAGRFGLGLGYGK
jgi:hypothetical protein